MTSLEARVAINETFGVVPFIDVGSVGREEYPDWTSTPARRAACWYAAERLL